MESRSEGALNGGWGNPGFIDAPGRLAPADSEGDLGIEWQSGPQIALEGVTKVYRMGRREYTALKGVNLKIDHGELVAIVGPSGSGKTTILNIITGIDRPTSGSARVDGRLVNRLSEGDLARWRGEAVGVVFQFFQLMPTLTALENVMLPMELRGTFRGKRRQRALEVLSMVDLQDHAHHLPSELSGGEQQRVAIARALANDPHLLVADEPTGNLDATNGAKAMDLLCRLNEQGKTLVYVTHDQELARRAQRIVRVQDGKIVADEPAAAFVSAGT